jgi:hypothetical protein
MNFAISPDGIIHLADFLAAGFVLLFFYIGVMVGRRCPLA